MEQAQAGAGFARGPAWVTVLEYRNVFHTTSVSHVVLGALQPSLSWCKLGS